jgi:hypothetical protein
MVNTETGNQRYHRLMSEQPPSGPPAPSGTGGFPTSRGRFPGAGVAPPRWPSTAPRGTSRALTYVALGIALIATGLAVVGWFRPSPTTPPTARNTDPTYTEQQIADAKSKACTAFETVQKGTTLQTNLPQTDDPAMANAQATHAQLSLVAGGWYLRDQLEPATPPPLAAEIGKLAKTLADVGANAIAGAKNADPPQAARMDEANSAFTRIAEMCK